MKKKEAKKFVSMFKGDLSSEASQFVSVLKFSLLTTFAVAAVWAIVHFTQPNIPSELIMIGTVFFVTIVFGIKIQENFNKVLDKAQLDGFEEEKKDEKS